MNVSTEVIKKLMEILLVVAAGLFICAIVYFKGVGDERSKWNQKEKEHAAAISQFKLELANKEKTNALTLAGLEQTLKESGKHHEETIARLTADHTKRLQSSTERGRLYERWAEASTVDARNLASHAAKLDTSLEEGRAVVGELTATIRLRDQQINVLGSVIQADRKLINEGTPQ